MVERRFNLTEDPSVTSQTIGQLAREAGVPTSTVRYYERRGLLTANSRSSGNYRMYDESACDRLHFIKSAQAAGFTLSDIRALLDFSDGAIAPCQDVQALVEQRLTSVAEQMTHLRKVKSALNGWLNVCKESDHGARCDVLDGLKKGRFSSPNGAPKKKIKNSRKPT
jgi:MerR family transcriptional regulator, mercuric resistance operon regulatory protein